MNKIIEGAKEAVAFAKDECEHDWKWLATTKDPVKNRLVHRKECKKCGIRVNYFTERATYF